MMILANFQQILVSVEILCVPLHYNMFGSKKKTNNSIYTILCLILVHCISFHKRLLSGKEMNGLRPVN